MFRWLKHYLPRSLYGRAALILLLPIVTLQLAVSVAFVQRYFSNVTEQLTASTAREVRFIQRVWHQGDTLQAISNAASLNIRMAVIAAEDIPASDLVNWYDLTGPGVRRYLYAMLPDLVAVQLPNTSQVDLYLRSSGKSLHLRLDRDRVSASNPHQLFVIVVVIGAIMALISYLFLRNQLRPILRLAAASEAFGNGRKIPFRPTGAEEVRTAGRAFLEMRNRIERHLEQRTRMLSGVSHDMRTPLTRLRLALTMMDQGPDSEAMLHDVDEMQALLDGFLDFARGGGLGDPELTHISEFLHRMVEDRRRAGDDVRLAGQDFPDHRIMVQPMTLRRIVDNLINNALRYGNFSVVSLTSDTNSIRILIEDDGPGIPEQSREEAVKPFVRLETARNQDLGAGVGLGLSIAHDGARALNGTLSLETSDEFGGLKAVVTLPR